MSRIDAIDPTQAKGRTKELFQAVQTKLGRVPNLFRTFGNSPAALEAYLAFGDALAKGVLNAQVRELIALAVAEANTCEYCLSAHTAIGKMVGLAEDAIASGRDATAADPKIAAALQFARAIVVTHGDVGNGDLEQVRAAGWTDAEITEIIANVVLNIFTNYTNLVAKTEIDFPRVAAGVA